MTLLITSAQVVETSVNVTNNSPSLSAGRSNHTNDPQYHHECYYPLYLYYNIGLFYILKFITFTTSADVPVSVIGIPLPLPPKFSSNRPSVPGTHTMLGRRPGAHFNQDGGFGSSKCRR